jgi:hypothetical protein
MAKKHFALFVFGVVVSLAMPAWARNWNAKTDWGATGNGKTDDYRAIQRGVAAMASGDTVVFPSPGSYYMGSTVFFKATGIRVKCQPGARLVGPNRGTNIFANLQSNTAIGGSATTGCIFNGGGVQANGRGGDGGQTRDQAVTNLTFTYNTFENMTYGPNDNFRSNGGIFIGGGSSNVVIRHNTFSNITPYDNGYNAAGKDYGEQTEPDGAAARAAIWFYGAMNIEIDHNTFLHDYQNIKGCQAQRDQAEKILIHHNYSDSHHRMFFEINGGGGCGNPTYNSGVASFQVYDNFDNNAGGPHPENNTFGFSAPLQGQRTDNVAWYNNLFKGVVLNQEYSGIGMEIGAENMNVYNNTLLSQWPCAGCAFGGSKGGYMQNNYACIIRPHPHTSAYFGEEHPSQDGKPSTTVTFRGNITPGACSAGLRSLAISLGPVTNRGGTLTATATVTTVEYGMQGVVFAIDGHYVSAVMGGGPYKLNYGAAGLPAGSHSVTATVVDAVGVLAVSGNQSVSTTSGVGPSGPLAPNVDPSHQDFDIAGNANDPINGRR